MLEQGKETSLCFCTVKMQPLEIWTEKNQNGIAFDSSTMFKLPNGALCSPDAAWISLERWNNLTTEEQEEFPPICPDFVVELRSASDSLKSLQEKMEQYIDNGTRLGWLINPKQQTVEIYRQGRGHEQVFVFLEQAGGRLAKRMYRTRTELLSKSDELGTG